MKEMTMRAESITILLVNRCYLYKLLQRIFGDEPDIALMEVITNTHTKEALQLIAMTEHRRFERYLSLFEDMKVQIRQNQGETLEKLMTEYTYLLIGPNKLPAPPWESVYLTKERTLFQESTLKVRRCYLAHNFLPAKYPHEADDHLALELDFMGNLADLTEKGFSAGKINEVKNLLQKQARFLRNHLLVWIDTFAEQIQQSKTHYFYPQMGSLVAEILKFDIELLEEFDSAI